MGQVIPHALGRSRRFYVKEETTFGTFAKPGGTDAMKVLKAMMSFKQPTTDREDSRQSRSVQERIPGRQEVSWSAEGYLLPSGTVDTPPDCAPLLEAAMGTQTVNAGTSVVWTLSEGQTLPSLSMLQEFNSVYSEAVWGAWVEQLTIKVSGTDQPKITWEGGAAGYASTGVATLEEAATSTDTDITVTTATVENIWVGSIIKIGTDDNSGAGYEVTDVDYDTGVVEFTPALGSNQDDEASVVPFAPTETTAGSPIAAIYGSCSVGGVTIPVTSFEATLKNNNKPINDEAFEERSASDFIPNFRELTGSIGLRLRRDLAIYIGKRRRQTDMALVVTCGAVAGKKFEFSIPEAELDFSDVEAEKDEAVYTLPYKALSASGGGELTISQK